MKFKISIIFALSLLTVTVFLNTPFYAFAQEAEAEDIIYTKLMEEHLPGEFPLDPGDVSKRLLRTFDFKRNGGRNGIAIATRRGLQIRNSKGRILYSNPEQFTWDVQQIRIIKLKKNGYYDKIVVAEHTYEKMAQRMVALATSALEQ